MLMITLFMVALVAHVTQGETSYNTGEGTVYKLSVVQDVTLERPNRNFNYLPFLLVSQHPGYPNKWSLVKFEQLPRYCPAYKIVSAKMYLYYVYHTSPAGIPLPQPLLSPVICRFIWWKNPGTSIKLPAPSVHHMPIGRSDTLVWITLTQRRFLRIDHQLLSFHIALEASWSSTSHEQSEVGREEYLTTALWSVQSMSFRGEEAFGLQATQIAIVQDMRMCLFYADSKENLSFLPSLLSRL